VSAKCMLILIMFSLTSAVNAEPKKLIDLTYSFSSETIYWPSAPDFVLKKDFEGVKDRKDKLPL
jgi:hypothetical protein